MNQVSHKRRTTAEFIQQLIIVHGDLYDYSRVEYSTNKEKVTIGCRTHGFFSQLAGIHATGSGCPQCGKLKRVKNNTLTTSQFVELSVKTHGHRYDYSKADYTHGKSPLTITCSIHGDFKQRPTTHISGANCPRCSRPPSKKSKPLINDFIERARAKHGDRYDYSLIKDKIHSSSKAKIGCPKHGIFTQLISTHLDGLGCRQCASDTTDEKKRNRIVSSEFFLNKVKYTHNNQYSYDLDGVSELLPSDRLRILCADHGVFEQTVGKHLSGRGCRTCKNNSRRVLFDVVESKAKAIHNSVYHYDSTTYTGSGYKMSIICTKHGVFSQLVSAHLSGHGCPLCAQELSKHTTELFIEKARAKHGDWYDYSNSVYTRVMDKIEIICPNHGPFWQEANTHLSDGCGCPKCGSSKQSSEQEQELAEFIILLVPNISILASDRSVLKTHELDIYLPEFKLAIEFNGLYYHSSFGNRLKAPKPTNYHQQKYLDCKSKGIELLQIFEDEWLNPVKQDIWKSIIKNKLGRTEAKLQARKCTIRELSWLETKIFLDQNHLMGADSSPLRYGLFFKEELVAILTFAKPSLAGGNKSFDFNLSRFAIRKNISVVGGFSRLLTHFQRLHPGATLQTAADLRYSTGHVYLKNGFELMHETKPNYWYWKKSNRRYHRFSFRKQVLGKKLENFDPSLTERVNMLNNGWNTVFDAGNAMFRFVNKINELDNQRGR